MFLSVMVAVLKGLQHSQNPYVVIFERMLNVAINGGETYHLSLPQMDLQM